MDLELSGKTAIVTGGSRGIGKAITRELAIEGVDVAIAGRGKDALVATAEVLCLSKSPYVDMPKSVQPIFIYGPLDELHRGFVNNYANVLREQVV